MTTFGFCKGCPLLGAGCVRSLQDEWVLRNDLPCRLLPTTEAAAAELTRRKAEAWGRFLDEIVLYACLTLFWGAWVMVMSFLAALAFGGV